MHALREEQDVSVQGAIVDLLAALRRRSDVTPSTVSAIDDALESRTPQQTSGGPASGIFISYRRDDEKYFAGRLYERLLRHFSRQQIFMDVDSIPLGLDFTKVVEDRLAQSGVMLVVIGKNWLNRSAHYPVGTASTCHTKTSAPTPRASFTPWKAH